MPEEPTNVAPVCSDQIVGALQALCDANELGSEAFHNAFMRFRDLYDAFRNERRIEAIEVARKRSERLETAFVGILSETLTDEAVKTVLDSPGFPSMVCRLRAIHFQAVECQLQASAQKSLEASISDPATSLITCSDAILTALDRKQRLAEADEETLKELHLTAYLGGKQQSKLNSVQVMDLLKIHFMHQVEAVSPDFLRQHEIAIKPSNFTKFVEAVAADTTVPPELKTAIARVAQTPDNPTDAVQSLTDDHQADLTPEVRAILARCVAIQSGNALGDDEVAQSIVQAMKPLTQLDKPYGAKGSSNYFAFFREAANAVTDETIKEDIFKMINFAAKLNQHQQPSHDPIELLAQIKERYRQADDPKVKEFLRRIQLLVHSQRGEVARADVLTSPTPALELHAKVYVSSQLDRADLAVVRVNFINSEWGDKFQQLNTRYQQLAVLRNELDGGVADDSLLRAIDGSLEELAGRLEQLPAELQEIFALDPAAQLASLECMEQAESVLTALEAQLMNLYPHLPTPLQRLYPQDLVPQQSMLARLSARVSNLTSANLTSLFRRPSHGAAEGGPQPSTYSELDIRGLGSDPDQQSQAKQDPTEVATMEQQPPVPDSPSPKSVSGHAGELTPGGETPDQTAEGSRPSSGPH